MAKQKERPSDIIDLAAFLWGRAWCAQAAELIGISYKTMRRYELGERQFPPALKDKLKTVIVNRCAEIAKKVRELD